MEFKNFDELMEVVKGKANGIVVPGANNDEVMQACKMGLEKKIISHGILIGPQDKIKEYAEKNGVDLSNFEIEDMDDVSEMANRAVDLVREGRGDFLVKGLVDTKHYMKAILRKDVGAVEEGTVLSHFVLFEVTRYHKLFALTDAAVMIAPTLEDKVKLINNSVNILRRIGIDRPRVSILCPIEKVNSKIPSTLDAQKLVEMNKNGIIKNAIVEGPYDIYITFSKELAAEKGVKDALVPGDVDLVLMPELNSANAVYKAISFFGEGMKSAAIVAGTKFPVILPSRTDSPLTKLYSIALASYLKKTRVS